MYRGVCFSLEKHNLFSEIANDNTGNGIEIKRFKSSNINDDIIVNDFNFVKRTEVNFERKTFHVKRHSIQQINNECAIYDILDVTGLMYNLQQETTAEKDGKPLRIRKGIIKDETGNMEIVFFSDIIDEVKNNLCHNLTKVRIQKFMDNRVLKIAETTTVTQNDKANIEVTDDELSASTFPKNVKAKVVKIDGKTVIQTYFCSTCISPVNISNAVGWCQVCDNVSSQNECKLKTDVKMTVLDKCEQMRLYISVPHKIIEKVVQCQCL